MRLDYAAMTGIIDEMDSCRRWIDPMLQSGLSNARNNVNGEEDDVVLYSAALLPTHPDVRENLYSVIFSEKPKLGSPADFSLRMLAHYDSQVVTRMWKIATDHKEDIRHQYLAASVLLSIDSSNNQLQATVTDIITEHSFDRAPTACFDAVLDRKNLFGATNSKIRAYTATTLLNKINTLHESRIPYELIQSIYGYGNKEALTLAAEAYLNGHFSLQGLKDCPRLRSELEFGARAFSAFQEIFQTATTDDKKESRRKDALSWLKDLRTARVR
jgi:hypothetical protein